MIAAIKRTLREAREAALKHPSDGVQNKLTELAVLFVILVDVVVILFGPVGVGR